MPPPLTTAANCVPSKEEAMETQFVPGAPVCVQVAPLLDEVQMLPLYAPAEWATAASRVPSAEEAMAFHCCEPLSVCVQFDPAGPLIKLTARPVMVRVVPTAGRTVRPPKSP